MERGNDDDDESIEHQPPSRQNSHRFMCLNRMFLALIALLVSLITSYQVFHQLRTRSLSSEPSLCFTEPGKFHITLFNDLHFGEGPETDWGPLADDC